MGLIPPLPTLIPLASWGRAAQMHRAGAACGRAAHRMQSCEWDQSAARAAIPPGPCAARGPLRTVSPAGWHIGHNGPRMPGAGQVIPRTAQPLLHEGIARVAHVINLSWITRFQAIDPTPRGVDPAAQHPRSDGSQISGACYIAHVFIWELWELWERMPLRLVLAYARGVPTFFSMWERFLWAAAANRGLCRCAGRSHIAFPHLRVPTFLGKWERAARGTRGTCSPGGCPAQPLRWPGDLEIACVFS